MFIVPYQPVKFPFPYFKRTYTTTNLHLHLSGIHNGDEGGRGLIGASWKRKPRTAKIPAGLRRNYDHRSKQITRRVCVCVCVCVQASVNRDKWMYLCTV